MFRAKCLVRQIRPFSDAPLVSTGAGITDCGGGNGTDDYMDCDHALRSEATDLMLSTYNWRLPC